MLTPLLDQVVLEPVKEDKKPGDLWVPKKDDQGSWAEGIVLDVGPGKWESGVFVKTTLTKGSRAIFYTYPTPIRYETKDHKKYIVVSERQVVALVPEGAAK